MLKGVRNEQEFGAASSVDFPTTANNWSLLLSEPKRLFLL